MHAEAVIVGQATPTLLQRWQQGQAVWRCSAAGTTSLTQQHQQRTCSLALDRRAMMASSSSSGCGSSRCSNSGSGGSSSSSSSSGRRSSIQQQQQAQQHSAAPGGPAVLDELQVAVHIVEQLRHHKVGAGINLRQPEFVGQRREGVMPRVLATGLVPA